MFGLPSCTVFESGKDLAYMLLREKVCLDLGTNPFLRSIVQDSEQQSVPHRTIFPEVNCLEDSQPQKIEANIQNQNLTTSCQNQPEQDEQNYSYSYSSLQAQVATSRNAFYASPQGIVVDCILSKSDQDKITLETSPNSSSSNSTNISKHLQGSKLQYSHDRGTKYKNSTKKQTQCESLQQQLLLDAEERALAATQRSECIKSKKQKDTSILKQSTQQNLRTPDLLKNQTAPSSSKLLKNTFKCEKNGLSKQAQDILNSLSEQQSLTETMIMTTQKTVYQPYAQKFLNNSNSENTSKLFFTQNLSKRRQSSTVRDLQSYEPKQGVAVKYARLTDRILGEHKLSFATLNRIVRESTSPKNKMASTMISTFSNIKRRQSRNLSPSKSYAPLKRLSSYVSAVADSEHQINKSSANLKQVQQQQRSVSRHKPQVALIKISLQTE